ncbi:MAG: winged helix-turn-helix domain-containing protein [Umezawaea sp.]
MADQGFDEQDKRLASQRVADALRAEIESGALGGGAPLPPYRQLAAQHDVAVNTAMAAVRLLRDQGWIEQRPNAGAYVRDRSTDVGLEHEIRSLRLAVEGMRTELKSAETGIAAVDDGLADVLARLRTLGG